MKKGARLIIIYVLLVASIFMLFEVDAKNFEYEQVIIIDAGHAALENTID